MQLRSFVFYSQIVICAECFCGSFRYSGLTICPLSSHRISHGQSGITKYRDQLISAIGAVKYLQVFAVTEQRYLLGILADVGWHRCLDRQCVSYIIRQMLTTKSSNRSETTAVYLDELILRGPSP